MKEFINNHKLFVIMLILMILVSIITFILYKIDKKRAIKNKWRISELTLLIPTVILGSFGSTLGIYMLRHKTKHWYFVLLNLVGLVLNILILIYTY